MCDVLLDVGDFFPLLKRWPMKFICLKTAENNFHELDIMGAYPLKHSTCCEKKIYKEIRSGGHEGMILIKCQDYLAMWDNSKTEFRW